MKVLICLSVLVVSTYATYVTYPYVYRPIVQNGFYPSGYGFEAPTLTVIKPFYPGFYDYRLGLNPSLYQPGLYPGFGAGPTIIHLIPSESGKKPKSQGKPKDGKDTETTTMPPEDSKAEDIEKAEAKDEEGEKSESIEVESV